MISVDNNNESGDDLDYLIVSIISCSLLFLIGLYLQIKIIMVSKRDKDVTWKLDSCHSIVMIVFYSHRIIFEIINHWIPSLHEYTGNWFCHFGLFMNLFGAISLVSHSLTISMYKYVYIVHNKVVLTIGVDKAGWISFWLGLLFPSTMAVSFMARPATPSYSCVYNCLGKEAHKSTKVNESSVEKIGMFLFCGFADYDSHDSYGSFDRFMDITNITGCFITSTMVLIIVSNVLEVFIYLRIFSFIRR